MKTSKFLIPLFSTILFAFSGSISSNAASLNTLPVQAEKTPAPNLKADWWNDLFNPAREIADPYFDNVWYASLYENVKQDIDNNHSGGNRTNEYYRICAMIGENQGIINGSIIQVPILSDATQYVSRRLLLSVREENGVVNCYYRTTN